MLKVSNRYCIKNISKKTMYANKKRNLVLTVAIMLTAIMLTTLFTVGGSLIKSVEQYTLYQVGTKSHGGYKFLNQEQYDRLVLDKKIKDLSFNIIVGNLLNEQVYEDYTEIRYTEELSAKDSFSYPSEGRLPEQINEVATCTKVLDDFGLPHELGVTLPLEIDNGFEIYQGDFVVCGIWEKPAETLTNQIFVSKAFQESFAPVWQNEEDTDRSLDRNSFAGSINPVFNFNNSINIEGKIDALSKRCGFSEDVNDGVNWAYGMAEIDFSSAALAVFLLFIIMTAGYLIIYNVFLISITADIHYYGLLKTVGTTDRQLKKIVLNQAYSLTLLALPLGLIAGFLISFGLVPFVASTMLDIPCKIYFNPFIFLLSAIFTWLTVRISCRKPCRIIKRISPVEAVRYSEYSGEKKKAKKTRKVSTLSMAWENINRNVKKTISVVFSIAISIIMINSSVSIISSFSLEKYVSSFAASDFTVADASLFNLGLGYLETNGVSYDDIAKFSSIDGFVDGGAVYMLEGWHDVEGKPLERIQKAFEEHSEWFTYGHLADEELARTIIYDDKSINMHVYGVDEFIFNSMEMYSSEVSWQDFSNGGYAIVSSPVIGDEKQAFYKKGERISVAMPDGQMVEYEVIGIGDISYAVGPRHSHCVDISVTLPSSEYLKHSKDNTAALDYCFNVSKDSLGSAEEFVNQYCAVTKSKLNYESRMKYIEDFNSMKRMFLTVGIGISLILSLIGVLNFVNLTYTSIEERKNELKVLNAVGMTVKQIKTMLIQEGLLRIGITLIAVFTVGLLLNKAIVYLVAGEMIMFAYNPVFWPMLSCIPIMLFIAYIVPSGISRSIKL